MAWLQKHFSTQLKTYATGVQTACKIATLLGYTYAKNGYIKAMKRQIAIEIYTPKSQVSSFKDNRPEKIKTSNEQSIKTKNQRFAADENKSKAEKDQEESSKTLPQQFPTVGNKSKAPVEYIHGQISYEKIPYRAPTPHVKSKTPEGSTDIEKSSQKPPVRFPAAWNQSKTPEPKIDPVETSFTVTEQSPIAESVSQTPPGYIDQDFHKQKVVKFSKLRKQGEMRRQRDRVRAQQLQEDQESYRANADEEKSAKRKMQIKETLRLRQELNERKKAEREELRKQTLGQVQKKRSRPLYERLERSFEKSQNARSHEALPSSKQMKTSISFEDIREHSKRVDDTIRKRPQYQPRDHSRTPTPPEIIAERERQNRKKVYSSLVHEYHQPTLDEGKRFESLLRLKPLKNPRYQSLRRVITNESSLSRIRKVKPNPMVPIKQPQRKAVTFDYLREMRSKSTNPVEKSKPQWAVPMMEDDAETKLQKTREEAVKMEKFIRNKEMRLLNGFSESSLRQQEKIVDMYLTGIRAKLKILNETNISQQMENIPPQHIYKIHSYLAPKALFTWEIISVKIRHKLRKNPYWIRKQISTGQELDFDQCRAKVKYMVEQSNPGVVISLETGEIWQFDCNTSQVSKYVISELQNICIGAHYIFLDSRTLFVTGGDTLAFVADSKWYCLDIVTKNCNEKWDMQESRSYHGSVKFDANVYVFGGQCRGEQLKNAEIYNTEEDIWNFLPEMPHQGTANDCVRFKNLIYIPTVSKLKVINLWTFNPDNQLYNKLPFEAQSRLFQAIVTLKEKLYIFSRYSVYEISPEGIACRELDCNLENNSISTFVSSDGDIFIMDSQSRVFNINPHSGTPLRLFKDLRESD